MRQLILDTETTGLDPASGHRIIEIGCIELLSRKQTGNRFHVYLNPEREVDPGAVGSPREVRGTVAREREPVQGREVGRPPPEVAVVVVVEGPMLGLSRVQ